MHVELHAVRPEIEGALEGGERIFEVIAGGAAVGNKF
jgi:hypothetical protein